MLSKILNAIFPAKCIGCDSLVDDKDIFCADCRSMVIWIDTPFLGMHLSRQYFDKAVSLAKYDSVWKEIVHRLKYNDRTDLADPLAELISAKVDLEYDLIVPVPLHPKRLKERGYNQSALLAKKIAKDTGFKCVFNALLKKENSAHQVGYSAKERVENVKGTFMLSPSVDIKGKDVLLIDDVITTGATLNECAKVLKENGAGRVDVMTLARA